MHKLCEASDVLPGGAIESKRSSPPRVFCASDVQLVSEGLRLQLSRCQSINLIGCGLLNAQSFSAIMRHIIDVVVLDFASAAAGGFASRLRDTRPSTQIVGIAIGNTGLCMADWAELGVGGFVDDDGDLDDVIAAILRVARGEFSGSPRTTATLVDQLVDRMKRHRQPEGSKRLTPRETEILLDLGRGSTNKEIARRLGISSATVKNHVHHLLEKLEVRHRRDAGALARSHQI